MKRLNFLFLSLLGAVALLGLGGLAAAEDIVNGVGMEFVPIPPGAFHMGADLNFEDGAKHETPRRQVTIARPFYLGKHEVTQGQWVAIMGDNPSRFKGRDNPVDTVSWADAQAFLEKLNQRERKGRYRLPTEAEWEYSARAGTDTAYFFGDDSRALSAYAWHGEPSDIGSTRPVGGKNANPWGLFDIYGNVLEWAWDWFGEDYYASGPATDPTGPATGSARSIRGCAWPNVALYCRSAVRRWSSPDYRGDRLGFRVAFEAGR
ncbi:MAG: formylglycine-generating enzyme family protein [Deltaproteobacteria bacterium]|nr:formylglycine-generating enzyme family protein [Deltaproteobacteria bacterium]